MFKLETFFNPSTGQISDALRDETRNNGRGINAQSTDIDSSVAGQAFQTAYAGVSSKTFGTLTFGRQVTLLGDGVTKYDPNYGSQAFSLIGMSGTYAGGGDTEDKRTSSTLKYLVSFADVGRFGALYKFNNSNGGTDTAFQVDVGADFAGASIDAYYSKFKDAVTVSSLSAAQVTDLPTQGVTLGLPPGYFSVSNSLAATVSDNTTFSLMGSYKVSVFKFLAGYEHIKYANPSQPLTAAPLNGVGFDNIGGYKLAYVNNAAFPEDKILSVYWAGIRYTAMPGLDLVGAFYGYHQNTYGTAANNAKCGTTVAPTTPGNLQRSFRQLLVRCRVCLHQAFRRLCGRHVQRRLRRRGQRVHAAKKQHQPDHRRALQVLIRSCPVAEAVNALLALKSLEGVFICRLKFTTGLGLGSVAKTIRDGRRSR